MSEASEVFGVDWNTKIPPGAHIRNSCNVEYYNVSGEIVAKAVRGEVGAPWHFGVMIAGKYVQIGELYRHAPEHLVRRLIPDIVESMGVWKE